MKIVKGETTPGESMRYCSGNASMMVLVERFPSDPAAAPRVVKIPTEPCHIYHFTNCRQTTLRGNEREGGKGGEGGEGGRGSSNSSSSSSSGGSSGSSRVKTTRIEFQACCMPPGFTMEWQFEAFLSNTSDAPGVMHQYVIDVDTHIAAGANKDAGSGDATPGRATCTRTAIPGLEDISCEFPTAHPYRHCVRSGEEGAAAGANVGAHVGGNTPPPSTRYVYLMASQRGVSLPFTNVVRHDSLTGKTATWHSEGVVGEPSFVPRLGRASAWHGEEDDGWVLVQLYLPHDHRTEFVVLDARRVEDGPVCRLRLPCHLPYAFHGTFAPEVFVEPRMAML